MYLVCAGFLLQLIRAYVVDSEEYRNGSMGPYPTQTYETHAGEFPIFNFDPFPSTTPPETPGYLLIAPRGANVTTQGALMLDWSGGLVWDGTEYGQTMSFNVQTFMGNQVLALWTGEFQLNGWGRGRVLLLDQQYQVVANISTTLADQGQSIDFHEAQITPNDTALVLVYNEVDDLISGVVQELNISTGEAIFTWDSIDHVPTDECYIARGEDGSAWDYIHLNSIDKDVHGNYLLSSRHCSSLFYVAPNGTILWRLGGRYSDFSGSSFSWQHDARWHGPSTISLFDNAANSWEETGESAMGVILELDFETMSVTQTNFTAPTGETSASQGGFQKLYDAEVAETGWLAGWGNRPYITEFAPDGAVRWHAQFGTTTQSSYRAIKAQWRGYPTTNPSIHVSEQEDTVEVLVSWSGATEVGYWILVVDEEEVARVDHQTFQDGMTVDRSVVQNRTGLQAAGYTVEGSALGWSDRWLLAENRFEGVSASEQNRTEGTSTFAPTSTTPMLMSTGMGSSATAAESVTSASAATGGVSVVRFVRRAWVYAALAGSWCGALMVL